MHLISVLFFWGAIALLAYTFMLYPLLVGVLGRIRPRRWTQERCEPNVSVVIPAYNEEASIGGKLQNLLSLDYPGNRLEVLIGSDGSTDRTLEELRSFASDNVRVFAFSERRGKPRVLNALIPHATGEIVVFADARQTFQRDAVRMIVRSFSDATVGAVTGQVTNAHAGASESYWSYEKFVRWHESLLDSTVVVTGAIYAIRKSLYEPIPEDTIIDDLLVPLRIARRGYRVVFEREARAYDHAFAPSEEFKRKVRTVAGAFQLFARERWMLHPLRNRLWWQTMSHKALRLVVAPLQALILISNLLLARGSMFYALTLTAQIVFYACAALASVWPARWKKPAAIRLPFAFCFLSWASVHAFFRWIANHQKVTWERAVSSS